MPPMDGPSSAKRRAAGLATQLSSAVASRRGKTVLAGFLLSGSAGYVYVQLQMRQAALRRKRLRAAIRYALLRARTERRPLSIEY